MSDNGELSGRVALVTGASYGLGYSIAEELARRGAAVMISDISDQRDEAAEKLRAAGCKAAAVHIDVRDLALVQAGVARTVEAFGRLDILVANAAMPRTATPILEMDAATWDAAYAVNVRGTLFSFRAAAEQMIRQGEGGRLIAISSTAGLKPYADRSHYCSTKAAVIQLTKVAGLEFASHKITANVVCPGQSNTENLRKMLDGSTGQAAAEEMRARQARIPLGPNEPIDIANAVAFFASPAARTVTGQIMAVEGGGLMTG
ncbi:SDR family NAD(P)-dependent oxidoreductase [Rhizorhabdus wittichii]|uniref:SDR family NAD(P)-dependent oxidoreductase n=1 Tax=Rhizorhabdus wittichii TaxID=160791 RepID=UPI00030E8CBB|nr:SDR family NAD(P)-dependent oxidoreductase [Rhizorhabdus wittichii]